MIPNTSLLVSIVAAGEERSNVATGFQYLSITIAWTRHRQSDRQTVLTHESGNVQRWGVQDSPLGTEVQVAVNLCPPRR